MRPALISTGMGRKVGIIAYGELEDRQRVEVLARLSHKSVSQWIIDQIRRKHDDLFAPAAPLKLTDSH